MRFAALLSALLAASVNAGDVVPYKVGEIDRYLEAFEQTKADPRIPEENAALVLRDLVKAYTYIASIKEKATDAERDAQRRIVAAAISGLRADHDRILVTLECARALGSIGDERGSASLGKWLAAVLEQKSPNPQWVRYGMRSLAWIGADDGVRFLASRATAKGESAVHALEALREFRRIDGETRRWLFKKILADQEPRDDKPAREEGLKTLGALAGREFETHAQARKWWQGQQWPDYVGQRFR